MNLTDHQAAWGDLLLGVGTPYRVNWAASHLLELPSLRVTDADLAAGDGAWAGDEYADPQTLPFTVWVRPAPGHLSVADAAAILLDYTAPRTVRDLWFKVPQLRQPVRLSGVRVRRRAMSAKTTMQLVELDLFAPDPTRYGETQVVSATGGGSVAGVNVGNKSAWPRIVVHGPLAEGQEVAVTDRDLGTTVAVSVPLTAGEQLVIDQQTGTALVDGWDDVGAWVTSRGWWSAQPGASFTADVTAPAGVRVDLEWEPAWW